MSAKHPAGTAVYTFIVISVAVTQILAQSADRRFPGKPGNPGASELRNAYSKSGRMGGGYRPYSAWSYQNNARSHAQSLFTYGKTVDKCDPATVREHVAEVRKNVAAAKKEVAALGDEAAKKANVKKHVDAMMTHFDEAEKMCATIDSSPENNAKVCDCCKTIDDELGKAEAEHKKMLDILGIHPPGPISEEKAALEKK